MATKKEEVKKEIVIKNGRDFSAVMTRIDKGDPDREDLKALSKEMENKPELYRKFGNAQSIFFSRLLEDTVSSRTQREMTERYIQEMKTELGYFGSTFVEKMLIDEIVMRWLRLASVEAAYQNVLYARHNIEEGLYAEKRLEMAQKRFLRAMDALAKVRKMIAQTQAKGAEMFKNLMTEK